MRKIATRPFPSVRGTTRGRAGLAAALCGVLALGVVVVAPPPLSAAAPSANLLVGDQSTFQSSTGGWVGYGVTLSQVQSPNTGGPGALQVIPTSSTGSSSIDAAWSGAPATVSGEQAPTSGTVPSPNLTAATPGLVYSGHAQVLATGASSGALSVRTALGFWNSAGTPLVYVPGGSVTNTGSWGSSGTVVAVAPPGAAYVAFGVQVPNGSGSWTLDIGDAVLIDAADNAQPVSGPLYTSGTQIVQANGTPVVPRGIDYIALDATPTPASLTQETFAQFHQWGFTMVRISINEDWWLPTSCAYVNGYQAAVERAVNWTTALGMVALIDLHMSNPSDIGAGSLCPSQGSEPAPDNPGSAQFWTSVAGLFKNNPLVAFDLFNEPYNISFSVWLNGGPVNGYQAEGMQQLYDVVRQAGARNLVFAEGANYANAPPPPQYLIKGYNIVYEAHWYTCPQYLPPQCGYSGGSPTTSTTGLDPWVTFQQQQGLPVFVGEFGWPSKTDGTFNSSVINFAQSHGWGWDVFAYDGTTSGAFDLVSNIPSSGPLEPSPAGMPVLADLALDRSPPYVPPPSRPGFWLAASDGGVFAFGGAPYLGSMGGKSLSAPVVSIRSSAGGAGYWLTTANGSVFAFGHAAFAGSMAGQALNAPIVTMSVDPITGGYWLAASDGG
ncbi:MAG: glycoside hydrolase family 5 protein, partial [Acidimicrobiales bacterium]